MKSIFTLVLLLQATFSYNQNLVLKTDILGPIRPLYTISLENQINKPLSATIAFQTGTYVDIDHQPLSGGYKVKGNAFIPEIRYYPLRPIRNWSLQPFLAGSFRYGKLFETFKAGSGYTYRNTGTLINYGLNFGFMYSYKLFWVEILYSVGAGDIKWEKNNYYLYPWIREDYLSLVKKFGRAEIQMGIVLPYNWFKIRRGGK